MNANKFAMPMAVLFVLYVVSAFVTGCQGCGSGIPDSPDGTVTTVATQIEKGNSQIVWEALPKSYQADINGLVSKFAGKMDKELWDKGFAVAQKMTDIAKTKKEFIMGSPMMGQLQAKKEELIKSWDSVVGLMEVIVKSELASLEDLKKFDGANFLAGTGRDLMAKGKDLKSLAPENAPKSFADMKVEKVFENENAATLKLTFDGKTETVEMVKVEGRWIPKEMADSWKQMMADAQKRIEEISGEEMKKGKMQALMMLAAVDAGLDQLKNANSQAEFDAIIPGLFMGGLMNAFGGN